MSSAPMLHIGSYAVIERKVEQAHLATAWANDVEVLATPILGWWAELASMEAIATQVPDEFMTVGKTYYLDHLRPSGLNALITVRAELIDVDDRLVRFAVTAKDGQRTVCAVTHVRGLVNRARFLESTAALTGPRTRAARFICDEQLL